MKIETAFNPGGKAFILCGNWSDTIREYTVGQVTVKVTESPGAPEDATIDGMNARDFSNYAPQSGYAEEIMCVETGIGSGSVYTYGVHAFTSMDAAQRGQEAARAKHAEAIKAEEDWKRRQREEDIAHYKARLAELERG